MFDDQQPVTGSVPANLPIAPEPVDMFAGVEATSPAVEATPDALSAGLLNKKATPSAPLGAAPTSPPPPVLDTVPMRTPIVGKIILFLLAAIVVGGLGFGGWWVYKKVTGPSLVVTPLTGSSTDVVSEIPPDTVIPPATTPDTSSDTKSADSVPGIVTNTTELNNEIKSDTILFGQVVDSDKDGLDDVREQGIGTDPNNSDTDGDTLQDGEEVNTWKTSPLVQDTDSDGYNDDVEIKNGYNPAGPGKLTAPTGTTTL